MATIHLSNAELGALAEVMEARYENVVETRQQTGDDEYDQQDEDECSALVFMLTDWGVDPDEIGSLEHLHDAIWVALDTPEAYPDLDYDALRTGARKVGYTDPEEARA